MYWYWLIPLSVVAVYSLICIGFFWMQEKLVFISKRYDDGLTYQLASEFEEVMLDTPNSGIINGIYLKAPESRGAILYLHGNSGGLNRWCYMAEEMTTYGYDVFAVDYRGYGKSRGQRNEEFMHEDLLCCWELMTKKNSRNTNVIYGRSLGSGFAVRLASRVKSDALILETPFDSLLDVAQRNFPFLPLKILLRYQFLSDSCAIKIQKPVLILHGTKDKVVSYKSSLALYNRFQKGVAQMVTIVGGRHNNLNAYPLFREKILEFLDQLPAKEKPSH